MTDDVSKAHGMKKAAADLQMSHQNKKMTDQISNQARNQLTPDAPCWLDLSADILPCSGPMRAASGDLKSS
jgi:hypothetical protein